MALTPGFGASDVFGLDLHYAGDERDDLQDHNNGSGEQAQERKSISWADHEIEHDERPREKGEDFAGVGERASASHFATKPEGHELDHEGNAEQGKGQFAAVTIGERIPRVPCGKSGKEGSEGKEPAFGHDWGGWFWRMPVSCLSNRKRRVDWLLEEVCGPECTAWGGLWEKERIGESRHFRSDGALNLYHGS